MMPHQQAALQAAMMNPAALSAIIQSQNPQLLHQIQHQQLQQLQQLHQQNLRLAAAFNQNQMGMYFSLLSCCPGILPLPGYIRIFDIVVRYVSRSN